MATNKNIFGVEYTSTDKVLLLKSDTSGQYWSCRGGECFLVGERSLGNVELGI